MTLRALVCLALLAGCSAETPNGECKRNLVGRSTGL